MEGLSVAWAVMEHLHDIIGIVYVCILCRCVCVCVCVCACVVNINYSHVCVAM